MRRILTAIVPAAALGSLATVFIPAPAYAVPTVTADQWLAAISSGSAAAREAMTTVGGTSTCTARTLTFTARVRPHGLSIQLNNNGTAVRLVANATALWAPVETVDYVDSANRAAVLTLAGLPLSTAHVKSPYGEASIAYLPGWGAADYATVRDRVLTNWVLAEPPDWIGDQGVTLTQMPIAGGATSWRAFRTIDPSHSELVTFDVDAQGRQIASTFTDYDNALPSLVSTCTITGYGVAQPLGIPKAHVAPIAKVGWAAWRLYWGDIVDKQASDVVNALVAAHAFTVKKLRQQAQISIYDANLQDDITVSAVPGGARLQAKDYRDRTVDRCIVLAQGIISTKACPSP